MNSLAIMENVRRYRTIASLYRQTAAFRPVHSCSLLAQASEWEHRAVAELEAYYAAFCSVASGAMRRPIRQAAPRELITSPPVRGACEFVKNIRQRGEWLTNHSRAFAASATD